MNEDAKPEWKHRVPYPQFKTLYEMNITKITHHWQQTGCDTSTDWVEVHDKDTKKSMRLPAYWSDYFQFNPDYRCLIRPTYSGERAYEDLKKIESWEKKHRRELSEYKRLKAKFEGEQG